MSITGEDAITVDRKYKSAWTGQLQTRFLILSNELFRLADASGALASRFILLMLTKSFYGQEDRGLTDEADDRVARHSQLGGRRLGAARQRSAISSNRRRRRRPWSSSKIWQARSALSCASAAISAQRTASTSTAVFGAWKTWCEAQGRDHPGTKASFGRDLRAAHPELKVTQPREEGRQLRRHYQGIGLKPDARCR